LLPDEIVPVLFELKKMKSPKLGGLLLLMVLTGCAQMSPPVAAESKAEAAGSDEGVSHAVEEKQAKARLPLQSLSEEMLFDFLMGEIGLQRRRADVASGAYAHLLKLTRDPRVARRATEIGLVTGNTKVAIDGARQWSEAEPESIQSRHMLVALLLKEGRYAEAEPVMQQVFATLPNQISQIWLELHDLLIKQSDREEVLGFAQKLAMPYPLVAEAHFAVGSLAWRASRYDLALQEIEAAEGLRPDWEIAALFHAQILQRTSMSAARDYLAAYLKRYPNAKDIRQNYARLLAAGKQYPQAREQMKILVEANPANPDIWLAYAGLSLEMKDPAAAVAALLQAQKLPLRDPSGAAFMLGQSYEELGRNDEAAAAFLSIEPGERYLAAQARYTRLLAKQGQLEKALQHLDTLPISSNEQKIGVLQLKVQTLRDAKQFERAMTLLDDALKQYPGNPDLLYDRAMVAERLNRIAESERDLREILRLKPDDPMALNALGYTLADRTDRFAEALVLIEKALKAQPNDPYILDSMGWVKYRMGKLDESLDYLNRAYSLKTDPEIAAHLGEVLWTMGRQGEARSTWQGSLKDNPGHEALMQVIQRLDH
jgi:tetratricopeptide (TPR) repeat protein